MKIAIINKVDLSVATYYNADAPSQNSFGGPWGDPNKTTHVVVPNDIDHRAAEYAWSEDGLSVVVTENAATKATLQQQDALNAAQAAVARAITFGQQLITKFAAQNILLGITQDGKTGEVLNKMAPIMTALQSGSMYEAITLAKAITPDQYDSKYITHDRIYAFVNEMEAYLGLPLSL